VASSVINSAVRGPGVGAGAGVGSSDGEGVFSSVDVALGVFSGAGVGFSDGEGVFSSVSVALGVFSGEGLALAVLTAVGDAVLSPPILTLLPQAVDANVKINISAIAKNLLVFMDCFLPQNSKSRLLAKEKTLCFFILIVFIISFCCLIAGTGYFSKKHDVNAIFSEP